MKKLQLLQIIREAIAPPAAGDAKHLEKARTASTAISTANSRINNAAELQQAFKGWITSLGIQSGAGTEKGKAKVPYTAVKAAVDRALREIDWK
jgi:hypothetical protein